MFILFTDFGINGPYTGQMKAVLQRGMPEQPVIDLFADAPVWDSEASAYLLAAYTKGFQEGDIFMCVVDPGVGSDRDWGILNADGRWFIGPDNGLFEVVVRRSVNAQWWRGTWEPENLSNSFHGRDIFAPVAVKIAKKEKIPGELRELEEIRRKNWPNDLCKLVYFDHYGNGITGISAQSLTKKNCLKVANKTIEYAKTFSSVPKGETFWYENSNGLVEIAVNLGRADQKLSLEIGSRISIL
ncbi:MAG: SAM-dependent chlorinase/fluorinase [Alphaproteobacteria bacterium]|nr:SAM-dependent chlorinase/fluorinase [Alphaproteobacteria bacterium]